ncbi:hypothetical protein H8B15_08475 [Hymenobacter sp. BT507]|uniref:ATP-binding protein n=2 Tax=Hymenobacter citatus TaxID=2763506 RepID=A0ABR7MIR2_9BACT|nr:hypothetical protein [Hymenobacter citatus]
MGEAIRRFYPKEHSNWDMKGARKIQAENIQVIASGPRKETSLVIYDSGEGQHPEDFEKSFLSLLRGNKNEIHFVQGKYNMGGSGAIVFCGKKGYQLIASKRFDGSGNFGFTLIREHPLSIEEKKTKKNTWYEFLVMDGKIPSFAITELDLGLHNRKFITGSIIKLYSYDLPAGARSVISRDLNQSLNEFLFEPALPILTVDTKERYAEDRNLERPLFGLKRRLEQDDSKYIDTSFVEEFTHERFGSMRVTCYVFKTKIENKTVKETRESIQREFFKNNMSVLFSMNGQVHGYYGSEFITRSLKLNLLKNHLLIHIDCAQMKYEFRKELFMASRDRLKLSDETSYLRKFLSDHLSRSGSTLFEIEKKRKNSISIDGSDAKELLKNVTKNIQLNPELLKLLGSTFKLEDKKDKSEKKDKPEKKTPTKQEKEPFKPQRFPSFLKVRGNNQGDKELTKLSLGGEKTVRFDTDVENQYFNRVEEPGQLKVGVLDIRRNTSKGGNQPGIPTEVEDILNVTKSSPQDGCIKVALNPSKSAQVGDAIKVKVSLTAPGGEFEEIFWVKITDKEAPPQPTLKEEEEPLQGLPEPVFMYEHPQDKATTWVEVEAVTGNPIGFNTIVEPVPTGDSLDRIYINMDSTVLKNFRSKEKHPNEEQIKLANDKYWTSVYLHTLFLYSITKNRKYEIIRKNQENNNSVELSEYLKDLFENFYSEFILNYGGMAELMQTMGE